MGACASSDGGLSTSADPDPARGTGASIPAPSEAVRPKAAAGAGHVRAPSRCRDSVDSIHRAVRAQRCLAPAGHGPAVHREEQNRQFLKELGPGRWLAQAAGELPSAKTAGMRAKARTEPAAAAAVREPGTPAAAERERIPGGAASWSSASPISSLARSDEAPCESEDRLEEPADAGVGEHTEERVSRVRNKRFEGIEEKVVRRYR